MRTNLNSFVEGALSAFVASGLSLNNLSLRPCIVSPAFFSRASIRASSLWIYFLSSDSSGIVARGVVARMEAGTET